MPRVALAVLLLIVGATSAARGQHPDLWALPPIDAEELNSDPEPVAPPEPELADESWFDAAYWFPPATWEGSFEFGLNGSEGNAQSLSFRSGAALKRVHDLNTLAFDARYAKTTAAGAETQHNAILKIDYDRQFGESPWSMFARYGLLYDEFTAFDMRWNLNAGLGRDLIATEATTLTGRLGAGASREIGGPDDEYKPEAVFGLDFEHALSDRQKFTATVDYFPEWGDFADYRVVSDASWELLIDADANLSLKLSVIDRYDSTPNGRRPNDFDYSLVLLWKL